MASVIATVVAGSATTVRATGSAVNTVVPGAPFIASLVAPTMPLISACFGSAAGAALSSFFWACAGPRPRTRARSPVVSHVI